MAQRRGPAPAPRRSSTWETMVGGARSKTGKAFNAFGRWLGVAGDEDELAFQRAEYNRRKVMTMAGGTALAGGPRSRFEPSMRAMEQAAALWGEAGDDDEDQGAERDEDGEEWKAVTNKKMCNDYAVAMAHYKRLRAEEREKAPKPGWFGGKVNNRRKSVVATGLGGRSTHQGPHARKRRPKYDDTMVKLQLSALPTYTPYFIYAITTLQVLVCVGIMAHAYTTEQWAPFGFDSTESCTTGSCPTSFNGTILTGATRIVEKNFLLGPKAAYLVSMGAKFTPCMRKDTDLQAIAAEERERECGQVDNICEGSDPNAGYGCCGLPNSRKGMTDKATCDAEGGTYLAQTACNNDQDFIVIRPCCRTTLSSRCKLLTDSECAFHDGIWHDRDILCSEVMCLGDICSIERAGLAVTADDRLKNEPKNPDQWVRLFIPLALHAGFIHLGIIVIIQYNAGVQIEKQAGFLRTALIYFISGVGGYVISGIFASTQVSVGADPAVYGFLGVLLVELFQAWQILPNAFRSLMKLMALIVFLLLIGTLPFVDNWSHIGGFFFGVVAAIIFLPYITFGQWDLARKRLLLLIAMPLLLIMFIMAFITFYEIQNTNFCGWCKYLNCIPYTSSIDCDDA
eukprot:m.207381 g.207381  ORF g.207381 m.207381 type:complete len:624 (+) comp10710_c0_seq1:4116-5987(+)